MDTDNSEQCDGFWIWRPGGGCAASRTLLWLRVWNYGGRMTLSSAAPMAASTWNQYDYRTAHYTQDISAAPWLDWGGTAKLGWMIGDIKIDPFNSNKMRYVTGATIYGSDNLTDWDTGGTVSITVKAMGAGTNRRAGPDKPARRCASYKRPGRPGRFSPRRPDGSARQNVYAPIIQHRHVPRLRRA